MEKLAQPNRGKLLDLLGERLAFERTGVALYDRLLAVMREKPSDLVQRYLEETQEHRDQEDEHRWWLEAQIRALGGDALAETPMSSLVRHESTGIEDIILRENHDLYAMLHALLSAELVDNAGWDLLATLAVEAGDLDARREFKRRLHEEEEHLASVRKMLLELTEKMVLGGHVSAVGRLAASIL